MERTEMLNFVFSATDTEKEIIVYGLNCRIEEIRVKIPNFTNAVTTTVTLTDDDDIVIYSIAGLAGNANYKSLLDEKIIGIIKVKMTLSGVPGAGGGTIQGRLYYGAN